MLRVASESATSLVPRLLPGTPTEVDKGADAWVASETATSLVPRLLPGTPIEVDEGAPSPRWCLGYGPGAPVEVDKGAPSGLNILGPSPPARLLRILSATSLHSCVCSTNC